MRDKVLTRAIIISIAVHLVAVSFIGRTSSTRLSAASIVPSPQRLLNVRLVKDPLAEPEPVAVQPRREQPALEARRNPVSNLISRVFGGGRATKPAPAA